jgi:hypothetical protein
LRRLPILLVALVLAVAAAGCGGGDDESSASGDTTTTETITEDTTTDETTTESTETDTDTDAGTNFNWASEDCQSLVKAYVGLSAAIGAASTGQDVSGDIEAFAKYVDEVPDEIKADVQTLASAYGTFLDQLKDLGLQPGQVPSADQIQALDAASKSLGDSDVQGASDRLSAWTTANCS